jgi:phosphoglycerate dehydrogenase-like enzyme
LTRTMPSCPAVAPDGPTPRIPDGVRPRALASMDPELFPRLFDRPTLARLREAVELAPGIVTDFADVSFAERLAGTELLITCWGAQTLSAAALERAPRLRAVVHAAGSVKQLVSEAGWDRGIVVSSAAAANARPVAEFTVAAVVLANKGAFELRHRYAVDRTSWRLSSLPDDIGNHRRVVGVVGASRIGRLVIELLRSYDLEVLLHDPLVSADDAEALGSQWVELDALCARSHVVTLHAPALPSTRQMIDARRLALLRDGATLVNTARGVLVDTEALTAELLTGRISAVLDHTDPERLPDESPLYILPNVFMTPHIAGSVGNELARLGSAAVAEIERFAVGEPFRHAVGRQDMEHSA